MQKFDQDKTIRIREIELTNNLRDDWPFIDEKNLAIFTSVRLLEGDDWVHYVTHDSEDGAWQFHPYSGLTKESEGTIISLEEMSRIEPRIKELADLPLGWHAWRESIQGPWIRELQVRN